VAENSWIIFDADNTLWDIESLYDRARTEFCEFLFAALEEGSHNSKGYVTLDLIERAQRHRDLQLYASLGYSSGRFAKSFEDTVSFFMPASERTLMERATQIALGVFDCAPTISDGLESLLAHLKPAFQLGIITAGDASVQKKRLETFRLRDRFDVIEIVDKKTAGVFEAFCQKHGVNPQSSWVVGDSIRSDILPAKEAGLRAVHLKAANWDAEHDIAPSDLISIDGLSELLAVVSG
jgi:putative hydrolase of the HAD superfamily